jgi:beta-fructofuranosidase
VSDPTFPALHGRPARGWVNDPNGCAYVAGRYHVFFQHNPAAPTHTAIGWGHMSSADLVRWRAEPLALAPRPGEIDAYGCWSGCLVVDGGTPTIVYSAVADAGHRAEVVLARGDPDLVTWTPARTAVAGHPSDPAVTHARDPFVFQAGGRRYAIQGAGHDRDRRARILVYDCEDLTDWKPLGPLLTSADPVAGELAPASIWECPNVFPLGDRWVLVVSLWHGAHGPVRLAGVRYLLGDLDIGPDGPRFRPERGGPLDTGPSFYAPQVLPLPDRTLLWAWSWELERAVADWAGSLTFPRELSLVGGEVVSRPAPELDALRGAPLDPAGAISAPAFDCVLPPGPGRVTLTLDDVEVASVETGQLDPPRILVDGSLVEIFPGGPAAYTTRAYPRAGSHWRIRLDRPGEIRCWALGGGGG